MLRVKCASQAIDKTWTMCGGTEEPGKSYKTAFTITQPDRLPPAANGFDGYSQSPPPKVLADAD
jgi:hypothetical protein